MSGVSEQTVTPRCQVSESESVSIIWSKSVDVMLVAFKEAPRKEALWDGLGRADFLRAISPRYDSRYEKFSSMTSPGRSELTASTTCAS